MKLTHPATFVALGLGGFVLARLIPMLFALIDTAAPLQWWASRATGFVAYVGLWLAMMLGLMISARGLDGVINRKVVLELHQQWTMAAALATGAHVLLVVTDAYVDMSWRGAAVPGSSVYLPGPVALGTIAMWGLAVLALSEWLQRRMNYMAWRVLHASAFGTFVIGLVHGVVSGTDSGSSGAQALYAGTAALLLGAIVFRVLYFPVKPNKTKITKPDPVEQAGQPEASGAGNVAA
jgi:predicted ferric reductase